MTPVGGVPLGRLGLRKFRDVVGTSVIRDDQLCRIDCRQHSLLLARHGFEVR
jgi:hypothetical protein